jgi:predicted SprT family Zn-dependent metalloprotease
MGMPSSEEGTKSNALQLLGRTFGSWTVLQRLPLDPERVKRGNFNVYWKCRCACGEIKSVRGTSLTTGGSSRCRSCQAKEAVQKRKGTREVPSGKRLTPTQRSVIVQHLVNRTKSPSRLAFEFGIHVKTVYGLRPDRAKGPTPVRHHQLEGRVFGAWTVLEKSPMIPGTTDRNMYWLCQCACGDIRRVRGSALLGGGSTQCKPCHNRSISGMKRTRKEKEDST